MNIELDRGAAGLSRWLAAVRTRASILMVTAHPDDEDGGLLAYQTRGLGARGTLLTLNRGEGGQNAMSVEMYDALGLLRTQELLTADRYYGVNQYWGRVIDYGFSKTREEALKQWDYNRVLSDVVRVVRMTRPLVIASVFIGAPTDGHGNHQVAGQMAQEAFLAAGDPKRFPEQLREGLRPWSPAKVYCRVPFFEPTKEHTIYDYATGKYVPIRFFDYVNKTWMNGKPMANIDVAEGGEDPATGLTFLQMGREGWGYQKSQNGGGTIPQPSLVSSSYHRYGSHVAVPEKEKSMYDGIDVSLLGIAGLASGNTAFLKQGLERISKCADEAFNHYAPNAPEAIAPPLADGLKATRSLIDEVRTSSLAEPGKSDVLFELEKKEPQFEKALTLALGLSFDAAVGPEKEPTGPFAAFSGGTPTFAIAIPGQTFPVQTHLVNDGSEGVNIESLDLAASDGKNWIIHPDSSPKPSLPGSKDLRLRFSVKVPDDATLTKPYFTRPDQEQPYYNLTDERYRNLSFAPYPLAATVRVTYRGTEVSIEKVVQTNQRIEGIGIQEQPLLVGPAISISVSPAAGAVPLSAKSFQFSCELHSNAKGTAQGTLRLQLPTGWESNPPQYPFSIGDGQNDNVTFEVTPHSIDPKPYEIRAVAEYQGKTYEEGYRLVGYTGLRPYPYYRPADYKAVGVDVKTAPGLRVAFFPGTGDDVPRALEDLGLHVRILSGADIESGNLSDYDAIILGTRAYAVRPELRVANSRLLNYVKNGGALIVQYNLQNFDHDYGPYPFELGSNAQKVVDETSAVKFTDPNYPVLTWPNKITQADFNGWEEERGHGFMEKWDSHYHPLIETHDPEQDPQLGGLLVARYGRGFYIYDAFALYRQLPSGVPGAYRILANLVSIGKNPEWK
jgi:LmbE family N-acetylglucosaminyl deacetylase